MKNRLFRFLFIVFFLSFLSQCDSPKEIEESISIDSKLTMDPVTQTAVPDGSFQTQLVITKTSSPTIIPQTITPTLSVDQIKTQILQKVGNNGECRFPCVWGWNPGDENENLKENFQQFPNTTGDFNIATFSGENSDNFYFSFQNEVGTIILQFWPVYENNLIKWLYFSASMPNRANEYINMFGHSSLDQLISYYSLSNVLSEYGSPDQIFFAAWAIDPVTPLTREPFLISLYYPQNGFLIEYNGHALEHKENFLVICPREMSVALTTWNPDLNPTLAEITKTYGNSYTLGLNTKYFKPINEVSLMKVEDFYQIYKNPDFTECFEVPEEYWR